MQDEDNVAVLVEVYVLGCCRHHGPGSSSRVTIDFTMLSPRSVIITPSSLILQLTVNGLLKLPICFRKD